MDLQTTVSEPTDAELSEIRQRVSSAPKGLADEIRRLHLRYPKLSKGDIAKRVGCDWTNVHRVLQRFMGDNGSESDLREYQENKADIFDALQRRFLTSISEEVIDKASLRDRVIASAVLEDKARVIRGQATGINVTVLMDAIDAIRSKPSSAPVIDAKVE